MPYKIEPRKIEKNCIDCLYQEKRRCTLDECFLEVELRNEKARKISAAREIIKRRKKCGINLASTSGYYVSIIGNVTDILVFTNLCYQDFDVGIMQSKHIAINVNVLQMESIKLQTLLCLFIFFSPRPHSVQNRFQAFSQIRQRIFHARRNFGIYSASKQSAIFHIPELCGQHLLRYTPNRFL